MRKLIARGLLLAGSVIACGKQTDARPESPVQAANDGGNGSTGSPVASDAGASAASDAGGGAAATDAGEAGTSDAGASGGGVGTASADCKGLVPASVGTMRTFQTTFHVVGGACLDALGDGAGTLAIYDNYSGQFPKFDLVSSLGGETGRMVGPVVFADHLYPQPGGFMAASYLGSMIPVAFMSVSRVDPSGALTNTVRVGRDALKSPVLSSPRSGGLVIAGNIVVGDGAHSAQGPLALQVWFLNQDASTLWGPMGLGSNKIPLAVGTDSSGFTLVVSSDPPGPVEGQWFGPAGTQATGVFPLAGVSTFFGSGNLDLAPLIGGGLALRRVALADTPCCGPRVRYGEWLAVIPSGSAASVPAPQWLASRPNTSLELASDGRAYAMLPMARSTASPCVQVVEILAPAGNLCGTVDFTIDENAACETKDLVLGRDGTVIQQLPTSFEQISIPPNDQSCTLHFWPAALH